MFLKFVIAGLLDGYYILKTAQNKDQKRALERKNMLKKFDGNGHTIYHGDAIDVLKSRIDTASIDLVFIDPPYNIGKTFGEFHDKWSSDEDYAKWAYQWLDECIRILKPTGSMYVMTSTQAMPFFEMYLRTKLSILSRIIWHYDSSGVQAKKYFGSMYEPILHCVKNKNKYTFNAQDIKVEAKTGAQRKLIDYRKAIPTPYNTEKVPGNVWYFSRVRYRMDEYEEHPSQKPEALLDRIVRASSNRGDIVLDPFAGSFTTAAVSKRLNRKSISIESQEQYVRTGLRRVLDMRSHEGKDLLLPEKSFTRRNGNGKKLVETSGDLFNGVSKA